MPLSMLAPTPPTGGSFPSLEWQTCPRGRDIESLKCACAIRIVRMREVQYSAVPCHDSLARIALCLYLSTLFDRRYACSSLLCWSSTRGYFIKYIWKRKFLSPSAITTVSWPAFTMPDPSIALDSTPVYNDTAVYTGSCHSGGFQGRHDERQRIIFTNKVSRMGCRREGFEFECCPVGGAIEF